MARRAASSEASVPGRTWRWISASSAVSVRRGSTTIRVRVGSAAICFRVTRAWGMEWECQGFLPQEQCDVAVLEVGAHRRHAEHAVGDPELPGLLLRERAGAPARAERPTGPGAVRAGKVIPLASAAVIEDGLAAVAVAYRGQPLRDLADRGVPVDRLHATVGPPAQRRGQPVAPVLVVVEPVGLLAGVALRGGMTLVTPHQDEVASALAAQLHLEAAVALAEDAGRGMPAPGRRHRPSLEGAAVPRQSPTARASSASASPAAVAISGAGVAARSSSQDGRAGTAAPSSPGSGPGGAARPGRPAAAPGCRRPP